MIRALTLRSLCLLGLLTGTDAGAFNLLMSSGQPVGWITSEASFDVGIDGSPGAPTAPTGKTWDGAFDEALQAWTDSTSFSWSTDQASYRDPCASDGDNGVGFEADLCGQGGFGATTLAVTLSLFFEGGPMTETDIVFNNTKSWGIYSGTYQGALNDFRRVAVHEIGHATGLLHEEGVPAVMAAFASNLEQPQTDDVAGITALYGDCPGFALLALDSTNGGTLDGEDCTVDALLGNGDLSRTDRFRVTVPESGVLRVRMNSGSVDALLRIYDQNLDIALASDDNGGAGTNADVSVVLGQGTYSILADSAQTTPQLGGYTLQVDFTAASETFQTGLYVPLVDGASISLRLNGTSTRVRTVSAGTYDVQGTATKRIIESVENIESNFVNDASGLRLHRQLDPDPIAGSEIIWPPLFLTAQTFAIGQTISGSGTALRTPPGGPTVGVPYSYSFEIQASDTVTVPLGTYPAVRTVLTLVLFPGGPNESTEVDTLWVVDGIGIVRETDFFDGTTDTYEMTDHDADVDGQPATSDNCPLVANPGQADVDTDGIGDACDADNDNDGVLDGDDIFPSDPTEWADNDSDGTGDNADTDDDNDLMPDTFESGANCCNPLDAADAALDFDNDGFTNLQEYESGSDPDDINSTPFVAKISDDLIINFGATYGQYVYLNDTTFKKLTALSPTASAAGDMDASGADEVVMHFTGFGLYVYRNNVDFDAQPLTALAPSRFAMGDVDGNGQADIVADFPGFGLYVYRNDTAFDAQALTAISPTALAVADVDGNGKADIVANFTGFGVYLYLNDTPGSWIQLTPAEGARLIAADIDNDGDDDLAIDFPGFGVYLYRHPAFEPTPITPLSPSAMAAGDMDDNGAAELVFDFPPHGIYVYRNGTAFDGVPLATAATGGITLADMDESGKAEVVATFPGFGVYAYRNDTPASWVLLSAAEAAELKSGNVDGN